MKLSCTSVRNFIHMPKHGIHLMLCSLVLYVLAAFSKRRAGVMEMEFSILS